MGKKESLRMLGGVFQVSCELLFELLSERGIRTHEIQFVVPPETEKVEIAAADSRPIAVDNHSFRMKHFLRIEKDPHAVLPQPRIIEFRQEIRDFVIRYLRKKDFYFDAPFSREKQSAQKLLVGEKIGSRDMNGFFRGGDGPKKGAVEILIPQMERIAGDPEFLMLIL